MINPYYFNIKNRITLLLRLRKWLDKNTESICEALKADLMKNEDEAYMGEIYPIYEELDYMLKNIKKLSLPRKGIICIPKGFVCIKSHYANPFISSFLPLIDAVAAGNEVTLTPDKAAKKSEQLLFEMMDVVFPAKDDPDNEYDFVYCNFPDKDSKNPVIITKGADLGLAASIICFNKYINLGQGMYAPDMVFVDPTEKDKFISILIEEIEGQFGSDPLIDEDYGKIINKSNFNRILKLADENKVVYGGAKSIETLQIGPIVMDDVTKKDAVYKKTVCGPILPVITADTNDSCAQINSVKAVNHLHVFTKSKDEFNYIISNTTFRTSSLNKVSMRLGGADIKKRGFSLFSDKKIVLTKGRIR